MKADALRQDDSTRCPAGEAVHPWSEHVFDDPVAHRPPDAVRHLSVVEGEGIGPQLVRCALEVLAAVESSTPHRFAVRAVRSPASAAEPLRLTESLAGFCRETFAAGGALLVGPGGGRFVYDLRRRFDLFCKLSPLRPCPELAGAGRMKPDGVRDVDILMVRENVSGVYQGEWREVCRAGEGRKAEHTFWYTELEVRRIVSVAARLAARRRGRLCVVVKDGGIPTVSTLWRDCASEIAADAGVEVCFVNIDLACYLVIQQPRELDVLVAPNLFGDILADLGSVLLGSRGLSFSGNFASDGAAVYQTNHGAAFDLVGTNRANPVGQVFALAMLLRESAGLPQAASLVEQAVREVWRQGWRTDDLREDGCRLVGTSEMGDLIASAVRTLASRATA